MAICHEYWEHNLQCYVGITALLSKSWNAT